MDKIKTFFAGVKKEISRIKWPDKKYMFKYSVAVIVLGVCLSCFFYLIDLVVVLIKVWVK
jgi:preprotein translocase SecE subunit